MEPGPTRRSMLIVGLGLFATMRRDAIGQPKSTVRGDLAAAELRWADQRGQMCSGSNTAGVGLQGEYFASEQCQGPLLMARVDGPVDFDQSLDWPAERQQERPLSVRWSGWVKPPLSGSYRFHANASSGARITVAKQVLTGQGANDGAKVELAAGRYHPITLEVARLDLGDQRLRLEWTAPHGSRFIVPRALLYLPTTA